MNLNKRIKTYNVTAKCFDGKIIDRVQEFTQIQFRNHPNVIVSSDGVRLKDAIMMIQSWNNQMFNTNYTYSLNIE